MSEDCKRFANLMNLRFLPFIRKLCEIWRRIQHRVRQVHCVHDVDALHRLKLELSTFWTFVAFSDLSTMALDEMVLGSLVFQNALITAH